MAPLSGVRGPDAQEYCPYNIYMARTPVHPSSSYQLLGPICDPTYHGMGIKDSSGTTVDIKFKVSPMALNPFPRTPLFKNKY